MAALLAAVGGFFVCSHLYKARPRWYPSRLIKCATELSALFVSSADGQTRPPRKELKTIEVSLGLMHAFS
jgi:hypothetical protein